MLKAHPNTHGQGYVLTCKSWLSALISFSQSEPSHHSNRVADISPALSVLCHPHHPPATPQSLTLTSKSLTLSFLDRHLPFSFSLQLHVPLSYHLKYFLLKLISVQGLIPGTCPCDYAFSTWLHRLAQKWCHQGEIALKNWMAKYFPCCHFCSTLLSCQT